MKGNFFLVFILGSIFFIGIYAQEQQTVKANGYWESSPVKIVNPSASKGMLIPFKDSDKEAQDGRSKRSKINPIIGKGYRGDDLLAKRKSAQQKTIPGKLPNLVFDSVEANGNPTDPSIAVGPNHVIAVWNTGYRIFDKEGNPLTIELSPNNIFSPNSCCDLTISYDNAADRWVMSILYSSDGHVEVAVSRGSDPVNDGWSVYSYAGINDYQKVSVWSDGYYMTANVNQRSAHLKNSVFALDRRAMLAGEETAKVVAFPLPGIVADNFYSPQALNVSTENIPAAGNAPIVYFQDDAFEKIDQDHLKIWTIDVDFETPENSTISQPTELSTTPFNSVFDGGAFSNLAQPNGGTSIDVLQSTVMNQAQFRKFPTHNSAVFSFAVDVDGTVNKLAGIRWYELRQTADGAPWNIYQEGTYTAPDGKHAWNGSMMMDAEGNIALGYSGMGGDNQDFVGSYYTGRLASSDLGTMAIRETLIGEGKANIPDIRYGDYAKMDIDPKDDVSFWHVNEYMNPSRANVVGVFKIVADKALDVGISDIALEEADFYSATEPIEIAIFNYGTTAVSNFEVSYQIDGAAPIIETYTGSVAPYTEVMFTFAQTADLSKRNHEYTIVASANLTGDEDDSNDSKTLIIQTLPARDLGIIAITAPQDAKVLGMEAVTVTIKNFGIETVSDFDVSYTLNEGAPIVERVTTPLASLATKSYTFNTKADLSEKKTHEIIASTLLPNDEWQANNSYTANVVNLICGALVSNTEEQEITPLQPTEISSTITIPDEEAIFISDINVTVNIEHTWVSDLVLTLTSPAGTEVNLAVRKGEERGKNYTATIFDDQAATPISEGSTPFTGTFRPDGQLSDFKAERTAGDWVLTITDVVKDDGGALLDWSIEFCERPEGVPLSVGDNFEQANELVILDQGGDQFDISLITTEITERLTLQIYDMQGQKLLNYTLDHENGRYHYPLNMSYAANGVYIIAITNGEKSAKGKIIKR